MLSRKPKEGSVRSIGSTSFTSKAAGLDAMVTDYQAEAEADPDNPNVQLILGHIHKHLGRDADAVKAYQRAVDTLPE